MMTITDTATLTIRPAVETDSDRIVEMGRHFLRATAYGGLVRVVPAVLEATVRRFVTGEAGRFFVAEREGALVGMLAAAIYPDYLSGRLTASEVVWWVEPTARSLGVGQRLLDAYESWALANGATVAHVGAWHDDLGAFYERHGYQKFETIYMKELT